MDRDFLTVPIARDCSQLPLFFREAIAVLQTIFLIPTFFRLFYSSDLARMIFNPESGVSVGLSSMDLIPDPLSTRTLRCRHCAGQSWAGGGFLP